LMSGAPAVGVRLGVAEGGFAYSFD
jgi:hypothetical protein